MKYNTEVIDTKVLGTQAQDRNNLYMIIWERVANSGLYLIWAKDEQDALERVGYSPEFCRLTAVKIDPTNLPVVCGKRN